MLPSVQTLKKSRFRDTVGDKLRHEARRALGFDTGRVRHSRHFSFAYDISEADLRNFATHCIQDHITEDVFVNDFPAPDDFRSFIAIAKRPGVTDDEAMSSQAALADYFNTPADLRTQYIFTQDIYYIEKALSEAQLQAIARLIANPLIHHIQVFSRAQARQAFRNLYVPVVRMQADTTTRFFDLSGTDEDLLVLSRERLLALNLEEMQAIRRYYDNPATRAVRHEMGLPPEPSDCELEILAQTWSEHCKHKEFNAVIEYRDLDTGKTETIRSLFKTYIQGATKRVRDHLLANQNDWLVKVFSDNAGVVKASDDLLFVWKVETHNSPSALDPYGGAITGILGVNRDALGTGIGGARLFFNTNVLCFGPPDYDKELLPGQLHPRRVFEGVVKGIEDGGNKSGVPTVNGAIVFDDRYAGKPLVYCGTGALMPYTYGNRPTWEKRIDPGDHIIMAGGRVGKDGIHGATFSSAGLDESVPMSVVQIGSPITQKKLADFLYIAARRGLIKASTDNGAGGLSSSVGELAEITNGAVVYLEKVPLKYAGLKPWEIFVSESQERMTLVVEPDQLPALFALAAKMEVEVTDIGRFTDTGFLDVQYNGTRIAYLDMDFLHNGVPQKYMQAEWQSPPIHPTHFDRFDNLDVAEAILDLLADYNVRSREAVIRRYDHEVQGKSIIKPLMANGHAPQDAAVLRLDFDSYQGIAVSNGLMPKFVELDPYAAACGAFDEAVRQIIAVGGRLPNTQANDGIFWSANDNFCVPDSAYHPERNPDGKRKLGQLVLMARALYDMSVFFDIPMTSGKDSMKNDFVAGGVKISVPPTLLFSMTAKIPDVRRTTTSEFKHAGDIIYQVGKTYDEMGGSTFFTRRHVEEGCAPKVREVLARSRYLKMMQAHDAGWIVSAHDLSDGGLAVALSESVLDGTLGADVSLDRLGDLHLIVKLFAESHSRFIVSVSPPHAEAFEQLFGDDAHRLGVVTSAPALVIRLAGKKIADIPLTKLRAAWTTPF